LAKALVAHFLYQRKSGLIKIRCPINLYHSGSIGIFRFLCSKINDMNTTMHHPGRSISHSHTRTSLITRFVNWTKEQEKDRILWLAIAIVGHGCFITIVTMFAILLSGNNFIFWPFAIGAMTMSLIVNLAAMPTKITIPVFFFSVLIDVTIIAICIANGLNINAINI
jgi:hypothetical protein